MNNRYYKNILLITAIFLLGISLTVTAQQISVEVAPVQKEDIKNVKIVNGVIRPYKNIRISSEIGGKIDQVKVEMGDRVKANENLIVFDQKEIKLNVRKAEATLAAARANLQDLKNQPEQHQLAASKAGVKQAQASLESAQANFKKVKTGAAPEQIDASIAGVKQAEAALKKAQANYEMAQEGATEEEIQRVEAQYNQSAASLEGARQSLEVIKSMYDNRTVQKQQKINAEMKVETTEKQIESAEARIEQSKINLTQAQNNLEKAKNNLEQAQKEYERVKSLYEDEVVSEKQLDLAKNQYENARSAVANAKTAVANAEQSIESARISKEQAEISHQNALKNLELAQEEFQNPTQLKQQLVNAQTQVEVSKANKDLAKANLEKTRQGTRKEQLEASQAGVEQAQASLESAQAQLAQLKSQPKAEDLARAEAGVKQAEASLERAEANYLQLKKGASEEKIKASEANVAQAEVALESAQNRLEDSIIKAPINGLITNLQVEAGEMVNPGTPLLNLVKLSQVYVETDVSAGDLKNLEVGDKVKVDILAYDNMVKEGQINNISPVADRQTQSFPVKVLLKNENLNLKGGMFADVHYNLDQSQDTIVVPVEAVIDLDGSPEVFVIEKGKAVRRKIKTGIINTNKVEVLEGLKEGEKIVVDGQYSLQEGDQVEVISQ
uniref:Efflux transporter, RND family, MFP subunit n=1 Tax=uncultured organism TaxID=155900 RepID=M1Q2B1_9ZZZZ|nr:efflux transporter, RND family, MFP subunit [uncultured organism]